MIYIYLDNPVDGTRGIVINTPSLLTIKDLCIKRDIIWAQDNMPIYFGGPVANDAVLMLHSDEWYSSNTTTAGRGYRLSSDYEMFEKISQGNEPVYWRIFSGVSSWVPGQLDLELAGEFPYHGAHSWLLADPTDDIMFMYDSEEQWEQAIELASQQMFDSFL